MPLPGLAAEEEDGDVYMKVKGFDVLVTGEPVFPTGDFHYLARGPVSKTKGVDSGWMETPEEVLSFLKKHLPKG